MNCIHSAHRKKVGSNFSKEEDAKGTLISGLVSQGPRGKPRHAALAISNIQGIYGNDVGVGGPGLENSQEAWGSWKAGHIGSSPRIISAVAMNMNSDHPSTSLTLIEDLKSTERVPIP